MIRLDSTLRKLEIVLAGAVATTQPSFVASWSDASATGYLGGANPGSTNGTTAVTLVAAPGAGVVRDVDCIDVVNLDTATAVATIRYNDNGTLYVLFKAALSVGDQLTYTHGQGWKVVDSAGALKSLSNDVVTLTGTQTLTNKTLTSPSVTDLLSSGLLTHSGGVLLSGSGKRITGDFSTATIANRVMFQSSTTNSTTTVSTLPNGTSLTSGFMAHNAADPTNAANIELAIRAGGAEARISSSTTGTGTYLPMTTYVGGFKNTEQPITGGLFVTSPATMGYGPGAGGTVIQATSKSTSVTLNKPTGQITMNNAALAAGATTVFLVADSVVTSSDVVVVTLKAGVISDNSYNLWVSATAGGFYVYVKNISAGSLSEAVVINFATIKGAIA